MFSEFQTTTYGKWILAGEHAVTRGHSAILFPLKNRQLLFHYQPSTTPLEVHFSGRSQTTVQKLFFGAIQQGLSLIDLAPQTLQGDIQLHCDIPVGVGLGASAAVCVAVARWFKAQGFISTSANLFARQLEDKFHGTSSGLDIAGVVADTGIFFHQGEITAIHPAWQPYWCLSYSGQVGLTAQCIKQVSRVWQNDSTKGAAIDKRMQEAVCMAKEALESINLSSFFLLKEALQQSLVCFQDWGLMSTSLSEHIQVLLDLGAMAAKPTGSGGGGYVLSLWNEEPYNLPFEAIKFNV